MTAPRLPLAVAAAVAAAAVGWRLTDLAEWPFPFHPSVQYESALAARALWVGASPAARTPDRAAEFAATRFEHVVSPPVLPAAVAVWYAVRGDEEPWAAKLFTAAAWFAACAFLGGAVVRQTGCRWAGVAAGGWLAFAPFGLMVCRSFQTEPVAVLGFALAVWVLARPGRQMTWRETLVAGVACGLAAATKPGVLLPPLAVGFAGVALGAAGILPRKALHAVVFAVPLALPSVLWVVVWLPHRGSELRPGLLADPAFYAAVGELIHRVVGWPLLALGLAGAALAARRRQFLPAGLFVGYVGYVGLFTYHCATHDYYHVPLLVPVALGLGWVAWGVSSAIGASREPLLALAVVGGLAGYAFGSRLPFVGPWRANPAVRAALAANAGHDRERAARYAAVRAAVGPGAWVVAVTEDYGGPLEFAAGVKVAAWPRADDEAALGHAAVPAADRLDALAALGFAFLVVTDAAEFERTPELRAAAERRGKRIVEGGGVWVYDLRR